MIAWLTALKARIAASTSGPWFAELIEDDDIMSMSANGHIIEGNNCGIALTVDYGSKHDAEFIAHSRTDLETAVRVIEIYEKVLQEILYEGNLAAQGHWDSTDMMKTKAYIGLTEAEQIIEGKKNE